MKHRRHKASTKEYLIAAALALLIVWLSIQVWNIARKEEIARHAAGDAKRQLATLSGREGTLDANLKELETPRGKEGTLRQTYGVAKPGEEVIIVVPPENVEASTTVSWWQSIFSFFGIK